MRLASAKALSRSSSHNKHNDALGVGVEQELQGVQLVESDSTFFGPGDFTKPFYIESMVVLDLVWRVTIVQIMKKSVDIVSYAFLGRLGSSFMAAAGLANVTANVVGNSIILGLGGPVSTICSQAHGAKNFPLLNETLQRAVAILLCTCVPLSIAWMYSFPIMVNLGQSEEIARLASIYLMYLIPGLFSFAYTVCLQGWLHAQQITEAPATIGSLTAFIHPGWCYFYIHYLDMGYIGAACAISTTRFLDGLLLTLYVIYSGHLRTTGFVLSWKAMVTDWWDYLTLGAPNILMTSQWWAEEVIIFLSGTYSNPSLDLAAMSIYQYLIGILFMIPKGFSVVASSRVGYHLGRKESAAARVSALTTTFMSFISVCFESVFLMTFRYDVGRIFINNEEVLEVVGDFLVPVLAVYVLADGTQGCLAGVMNGLGRQQLAGPVVFFCYYLFGIPLAWYLGSEKRGLGLGVLGLTIGIAIGTWVHAALYLGIVYCTNWEAEVDRTKARVDKYDAKGNRWMPVNADEAEEVDEEENEEDEYDDDLFDDGYDNNDGDGGDDENAEDENAIELTVVTSKISNV